LDGRANGSRYRLVGGTRERHFDGTNLKPRKPLENAQTPTSRVHAVLGNLHEHQTRLPQKGTTAVRQYLLYMTQTLTTTKRLMYQKAGKSIAFA
jgi:hypothetical protein